MGHYTGPKSRINRRLGAMIYENAGARRAYERRDNSMPGMHPRRNKVSDYGLALLEKQKIKHFYGLSERQLRRLYDEAVRHPGNTGEYLLTLCELRLDNIIRRAGLTLTRPQARQGVAHGHFYVDGRRCDIPSRILRPGEVVYVKPRAALQKIYRGIGETEGGPVAGFLSLDLPRLTIRVERLPLAEDVSLPVEVGSVVELLSR
jgi:small subunit ribosomal protein S4